MRRIVGPLSPTSSRTVYVLDPAAMYRTRNPRPIPTISLIDASKGLFRLEVRRNIRNRHDVWMVVIPAVSHGGDTTAKNPRETETPKSAAESALDASSKPPIFVPDAGWTLFTRDEASGRMIPRSLGEQEVFTQGLDGSSVVSTRLSINDVGALLGVLAGKFSRGEIVRRLSAASIDRMAVRAAEVNERLGGGEATPIEDMKAAYTLALQRNAVDGGIVVEGTALDQRCRVRDIRVDINPEDCRTVEFFLDEAFRLLLTSQRSDLFRGRERGRGSLVPRGGRGGRGDRRDDRGDIVESEGFIPPWRNRERSENPFRSYSERSQATPSSRLTSRAPVRRRDEDLLGDGEDEEVPERRSSYRGRGRGSYRDSRGESQLTERRSYSFDEINERKSPSYDSASPSSRRDYGTRSRGFSRGRGDIRGRGGGRGRGRGAARESRDDDDDELWSDAERPASGGMTADDDLWGDVDQSQKSSRRRSSFTL